MSNGARHGLGVLVGLVVTPIIALCMMYGVDRLGRTMRVYLFSGNDKYLGAAVLLVAALLLGLVVGSRVSPLASLIPGAGYTAIGLVWLLAPRWAFEHAGRDILPREMWGGYATLAPLGIFLLIGVVLLVASLAPSRWKAARPAAGYGAPPAPMGPPMHGAPAHMGPPPAPQYGQPQWQGAPQYGQPPAQPGPGNPPPLPSAPPAAPSTPPAPPADDKPASAPQSGSDRNDPDDDEPGEWTKVYGGGNR
ncbi:hypothetical protein E1200_10610 [Actinomadura sp. GC306]|uniref:hypothetical protein n=1 Tax=Actinomadura sp. GC306 TaxID=2530367 RepID=UPI0010473F3E|nr:hypothetical protein [Actinomadura sp. GC306]TDC68798.1 hypothetical protein E1200_10610 [Actinomadura sp. GC306]